MATSNIKTTVDSDIHKVWETVLAIEKYSEWRSDLSKTETINEKQFIEYTKKGYATTFTVTALEPYKRWEFDMENANMNGHWVGIFTSVENETQIEFTEDVIPKKVVYEAIYKILFEKAADAICFGLKERIG